VRRLLWHLWNVELIKHIPFIDVMKLMCVNQIGQIWHINVTNLGSATSDPGGRASRRAKQFESLHMPVPSVPDECWLEICLRQPFMLLLIDPPTMFYPALVCLTLNYWTDLHQHFTRGVCLDKEHTVGFWKVIRTWTNADAKFVWNCTLSPPAPPPMLPIDVL